MSRAQQCDVTKIQDEDVLRRMWQDTDDFSKKKEIRSHMYKLREARLKDFYNTDEVVTTKMETSRKIGDAATRHADSLLDHSFLSLKSKEIRDSESPTREIAFKPKDKGWSVQQSSQQSDDGKTRVTTRTATTSGTQDIRGGTASFAAKNEQRNAVRKDDGSKIVDKSDTTFVRQEASGGDDNSKFYTSSTSSTSSSKYVSESKSHPDGKTKVFTESKNMPDGSTVTTTRYESVGGAKKADDRSEQNGDYKIVRKTNKKLIGGKIITSFEDVKVPRAVTRTVPDDAATTRIVRKNADGTEEDVSGQPRTVITETVTRGEPRRIVTSTETVTRGEPRTVITRGEPRRTVTSTETVTRGEPRTVITETVTRGEPRTVITRGEPRRTVTSTETVTRGEPRTVITETVTRGEPRTVITETVTRGEPRTVITETVTRGEPRTVITETVTKGEPRTVTRTEETVIRGQPRTITTEETVIIRGEPQKTSKTTRTEVIKGQHVIEAEPRTVTITRGEPRTVITETVTRGEPRTIVTRGEPRTVTAEETVTIRQPKTVTKIIAGKPRTFTTEEIVVKQQPDGQPKTVTTEKVTLVNGKPVTTRITTTEGVTIFRGEPRATRTTRTTIIKSDGSVETHEDVRTLRSDEICREGQKDLREERYNKVDQRRGKDVQKFISEDTQKFSTEDVQKFTTEDVRKFRTEDVQKFRTEDVQKFTTEDRQKFTNEDVQKFANKDVQKFSTEDEQKFSTKDVRKFSTKDVQKFGSKDEQKFSTKDVQKFANEDVQKFANKDVKKFSTEDVQKFSTKDVQKFGTQDAQKFTSEDVQKFSTKDVQKFANKDVQKFSTEDVRKFSSKDVQKFTTEDVQRFSSKDVQSFKDVTVSQEDNVQRYDEPKGTKFTREDVVQRYDKDNVAQRYNKNNVAQRYDQDTTDNVPRLTRKDVQKFTNEDVQRFSNEDVQRFSNEDVQRFANEDVQRFTKEDVQRFANEDVQRFTNKDVQRFTKEDVQRFKNEDVQRFTNEDVQRFKNEDVQRFRDDDVQTYKDVQRFTKDDVQTYKDVKVTKDVQRFTNDDVQTCKDVNVTKDVQRFKDTSVDVQKQTDVQRYKDTTDNVQRIKDVQTFKDVTENVQRYKDTKIDVQRSKDTSEDVQRYKDTKIDDQRSKDTSVDVQRYKDTKIDVQRYKDTKIDVQRYKDTKIDVQRSKDTSVDVQRYKDTSVDVQRHKDTSVNVQRHKDTSEDVQRHKDTSEDVQRYKDTSVDVQRHKDTSVDVQRYKDTSVDVQRLKDTKIDVQRSKDITVDVQRSKDIQVTSDVQTFNEATENIQRYKDTSTTVQRQNEDVQRYKDIRDNVQRFEDVKVTRDVQTFRDVKEDVQRFKDVREDVQRFKDVKEDVQRFKDTKDVQNISINVQNFNDDKTIGVKKIKTTEDDVRRFQDTRKICTPSDDFITNEKQQRVKESTPQEPQRPSGRAQPVKPHKSELDAASQPTDGQYDTTYRSEFTNKKISVDVSATHDAFARSLRSVTPERERERPGSARSYNSSRDSPEKKKYPSQERYSPEKKRAPSTESPSRCSPYPSGERYSPEKKRTPSQESPSRYSPEKRTPSQESPSRYSPEKKRTPSQESPSRYSPEKKQPSTQRYSPEKRTPSTESPSRHSPGKDAPGKQHPQERHSPEKKTPKPSTERHSPEKKRSPSQTIDSSTLTRKKKPQPRSRSSSPTDTVSDFEYITNRSEITTDLDTNITTVEKKRTRKVTDRSTTSPLTEPKSTTRRSSQPESPGRPSTPKSYRRTDTYEERCRQILGITGEPKKPRKPSLPDEARRGSFDRKKPLLPAEARSTSPEKKPGARRSPEKKPDGRRVTPDGRPVLGDSEKKKAPYKRPTEEDMCVVKTTKVTTITKEDGRRKIPDDRRTPERNVPDDRRTPERKVPDDGRTLERKIPDDRRTPERKVPDDRSSPERKVPDDGRTPERKVPDDRSSPERKVPDDGRTPERKIPDDRRTPERKIPDDRRTPERTVIDRSTGEVILTDRRTVTDRRTPERQAPERVTPDGRPVPKDRRPDDRSTPDRSRIVSDRSTPDGRLPAGIPTDKKGPTRVTPDGRPVGEGRECLEEERVTYAWRPEDQTPYGVYPHEAAPSGRRPDEETPSGRAERPFARRPEEERPSERRPQEETPSGRAERPFASRPEEERPSERRPQEETPSGRAERPAAKRPEEETPSHKKERRPVEETPSVRKERPAPKRPEEETPSPKKERPSKKRPEEETPSARPEETTQRPQEVTTTTEDIKLLQTCTTELGKIHVQPKQQKKPKKQPKKPEEEETTSEEEEETITSTRTTTKDISETFITHEILDEQRKQPKHKPRRPDAGRPREKSPEEEVIEELERTLNFDVCVKQTGLRPSKPMIVSEEQTEERESLKQLHKTVKKDLSETKPDDRRTSERNVPDDRRTQEEKPVKKSILKQVPMQQKTIRPEHEPKGQPKPRLAKHMTEEEKIAHAIRYSKGDAEPVEEQIVTKRYSFDVYDSDDDKPKPKRKGADGKPRVEEITNFLINEQIEFEIRDVVEGQPKGGEHRTTQPKQKQDEPKAGVSSGAAVCEETVLTDLHGTRGEPKDGRRQSKPKPKVTHDTFTTTVKESTDDVREIRVELHKTRGQPEQPKQQPKPKVTHETITTTTREIADDVCEIYKTHDKIKSTPKEQPKPKVTHETFTTTTRETADDVCKIRVDLHKPRGQPEQPKEQPKPKVTHDTITTTTRETADDLCEIRKTHDKIKSIPKEQPKPKVTHETITTTSRETFLITDDVCTIWDKPKTLQDKPKSAQDKPKTAQDKPKTAQDKPKSVQDIPRTAQDVPRTAQDVPRTVQDKPKTVQDKPKAVQDKPKSVQDKPKTVQDTHKTVQDTHKTVQEKLRTVQDKPRSVQDKPRSVQDKPKTPQDKPKTAQDKITTREYSRESLKTQSEKITLTSLTRDKPKTTQDKPKTVHGKPKTEKIATREYSRESLKTQMSCKVTREPSQPKAQPKMHKAAQPKPSEQKPGKKKTALTTCTIEIRENKNGQPKQPEAPSSRLSKKVVSSTIELQAKPKTTVTTVKTKQITQPKPKMNGHVETYVAEDVTRIKKTVRHDSKPRQPKQPKCVSTKSIIVNETVADEREIIVDLQRSKSSREDTPDHDRVWPITNEEDSGMPRLPDQIVEPEEPKPKHKYVDIPEDECIDELSRFTELINAEITEVDRVEETDECLLTINEKVSKFSKPDGKKPKGLGRAPKVERPTLLVDEALEKDECLLSVSDKVTRFVATAEKLGVQDVPERPKSPRCKYFEPNDCADKINKFIESAEQLTKSEIRKVEDYNKPKDETPKSSKGVVRLRSTESIKKAKHLFEPAERADKPKQRDILGRPSVFEGRRTPQQNMENVRRTLKYDEETDRQRTKSPSPITKRVSTPEPGDVPHYMLQLDRSLRQKSPHIDSVHELEMIAKGQVPPIHHEEMPKGDHSKEHPKEKQPKDRHCRQHSPKPSSKFGVVLRKTEVEKTSEKLEKRRGSAVSVDVDGVTMELEIEDTYDLEILEILLEKVIGYDIRKRIRAQIRLVKTLIEEGKINMVTKRLIRRKEATPERRESSSYSTYSERRRSSDVKVEETCSRTSRMSPSKNKPTTPTSPTFAPFHRAASPGKSLTFQRNAPERRTMDSPTSPTFKPFQRNAPETRSVELRKTTQMSKAIVDEKPEWVTQKKLRKVTESGKKTVTTDVKKEKPTDLITSGYGVGPTDENGSPLFGLRALRTQSKKDSIAVQGTVTRSTYYSENGAEPVGEISVTKYSSDPRDLMGEEGVEQIDGVLSKTTTQKFGRKGSPSPKKITDKKRLTETSDELRTSSSTSTKFTRKGSVKEMSQKFLDNAVETLKSEKQSSYPKAGLILRTSSFKDSKEDSTITSEEEQELHRTVTVKKSRGSKGETFLSNTSKVTGVQDVITRMKTEEYVEGDSQEDREARDALNKFLGSQVLLAGMEGAGGKTSSSTSSRSQKTDACIETTTVGSAVKKSIKVTTTITENGISRTTTRSFDLPITEDVLETVWDEQTLRLLLEQSTEYEERRIIRARLKRVMAEKEACSELTEKTIEETRAGTGAQGESLLLPILQGAALDAASDQPAATNGVNGGGVTVDSGTESGEDLRTGLIAEVQGALDKLSACLCSESGDITDERRDSLLQLVNKLQANLTGSEEVVAGDGGRFAKRRSRGTRHTVGVTTEELEDARKLMEEIAYGNPLQKQNSEGCVQENKGFRPVKFQPVKNALPKPFSGSNSLSQSASSSTVDTPTIELDVGKSTKSFQQSHSLDYDAGYYKSPVVHSTSVDYTKEMEVKAVQQAVQQAAVIKAIKAEILESETDEDNTVKLEEGEKVVLYDQGVYSSKPNPAPDLIPESTKLNGNSTLNKRLKMKRANTIDIPKPLNYYQYDDDDDESEAEASSNRRSTYLALRGPIRVGKSSNTNAVPAFEPKTESDKKFIAFLNKQNDSTGVANKINLWDKKNATDANWQRKFGNIKTNFEKVSGTATSGEEKKNVSSARNFWKSADDSLSAGSLSYNGPKISRQNAKNLQQMFEQKKKDGTTKLPWSDDKNAVIGSLKIEPHKNYKFVPQPLTVNKFSHNPQSAFKPIKNVAGSKVKSNSSSDTSTPNTPMYLYSPKSFDFSNQQSTAPWASTPKTGERRVLSLAHSKFENHQVEEPPKMKPKREGAKEKVNIPATLQNFEQKEKLPTYVAPQSTAASVRKLSGQYDSLTSVGREFVPPALHQSAFASVVPKQHHQLMHGSDASRRHHGARVSDAHNPHSVSDVPNPQGSLSNGHYDKGYSDCDYDDCSEARPVVLRDPTFSGGGSYGYVGAVGSVSPFYVSDVCTESRRAGADAYPRNDVAYVGYPSELGAQDAEKQNTNRNNYSSFDVYPSKDSAHAGNQDAHAGKQDAYAYGQGAYAGGQMAHPGGPSAYAAGQDAYAGGQNAHPGGRSAYAGGQDAYAAGQNAHPGVQNAYAGGQSAYAGGRNAHPGGQSAYAGGQNAYAGAENAHSGGQSVYAAGQSAYAGGLNAHPGGQNAYAGGQDAYAGGQNAHPGGQNAYAGGQDAYAGGQNAHPGGQNAYVGGQGAYAGGQNAHPGGRNAYAGRQDAYAGGQNAHPGGQSAYAGGQSAYAGEQNAHPDGQNAYAGVQKAYADGQNAHPGGQNAHPGGQNAYAGGLNAYAGGQNAHPGEQNTYARGQNAHSGGQNAHSGVQNAYAGNQSAYAGSQGAYAGSQSAYALNQNAYPGDLDAFPSKDNAYSSNVNSHSNKDNAYSGKGSAYPGKENAYPGNQNVYSDKGNAYAGSQNAYTSAGKSSAYSGRDSAYSGKDSAYTGRDSAYAGKDSAYSGKDSAYSGRDSAYSSKDHAYTGKGSAYLGKDATHSGKDSAYTNKSSAYTGKDSAYTGKDNAYSGRESAYTGKDSAYSGRDSAYSSKDHAYTGKGSAYSGKDAVHPGTDSAYTNKSSAYPVKDSAYTGKDSAYSGKYNAHSGKDSAYSGKNSAYPGNQNTYPGNEQLRNEQLRSEQLRNEQLRNEHLRNEYLRTEQLRNEHLRNDQVRNEHQRNENAYPGKQAQHAGSQNNQETQKAAHTLSSDKKAAPGVKQSAQSAKETKVTYAYDKHGNKVAVTKATPQKKSAAASKDLAAKQKHSDLSAANVATHDSYTTYKAQSDHPCNSEDLHASPIDNQSPSHGHATDTSYTSISPSYHDANSLDALSDVPPSFHTTSPIVQSMQKQRSEASNVYYNNVKPGYVTQDSLHEHNAVSSRVMTGPVAQTAVTVNNKPKNRNEHDMDAAFNLKNTLQKLDKNRTPAKPTSPVKPNLRVNDKPIESLEITDRGESIVTSKFHIAVKPAERPTAGQVLSKCDSWHQICQEKSSAAKPSPRGSPSARTVIKSKSTHTLALPKQFEAGMSRDEMATKKRTMEAYFAAGSTSPVLKTPAGAKRAINRLRTSEKTSSTGLCRSRTLPDIVCAPDMLDESNVDAAFEDLFKASS